MADINSSLPVRTQTDGDVVASLTELPAPGALADNTANPTASQIAAFGMIWDGATWDRLPGTSADGVTVNLSGNNDVTITGTVTVDSELPAAAALADNTANPTVPGVGAFGMVYDGATWDRTPGTSADGMFVKVTNTVPVTFGNAVATGEVNNYDTTSAVGAGATDNHDYTVTALKTLLLKGITASASGKMKVVMTSDPAGTPVILGTFFISTATPNYMFEFPQPYEVAAGLVLRVARTNLEASAMDVYSTINGIEV